MCGRYAYLFTWQELHRLLSLGGSEIVLTKRYNLAPSQLAPVVRKESSGRKTLALLRWGLIPSWAKEEKIGHSLINARAETIASKPSFRSAFKARRCLVPISGFYEWQKSAEKGRKQAYYIKGKDSILLLAGLWEKWRPHKENNVVESFSIITTEANELLRPIHERMPVILNLEDGETWLNPQASANDLQSLLQPCSEETLDYYAVSSLVNNPRKDEEGCLQKDEKAMHIAGALSAPLSPDT